MSDLELRKMLHYSLRDRDDMDRIVEVIDKRCAMVGGLSVATVGLVVALIAAIAMRSVEVDTGEDVAAIIFLILYAAGVFYAFGFVVAVIVVVIIDKIEERSWKVGWRRG